MDIMGMMKKAKELQAKMEETKQGIAEMEVFAESGAGMVQVRLAGTGECTHLAIDPELIKPEEKEVLEDLVMAAVNSARRELEEETKKRMAEVTEGLPLPPGFSL